MENSLANKKPWLVAEWSERNGSISPDDVPYGSKKLYWWHGSCGHEWQASVKARSSGENCPICSNARIVAGINDLASLKPELLKEWSPNNTIQPTEIGVGSHKKVLWIGACGHEWSAEIRNRVRGAGCPYCSHNAVLQGFNDLATVLPQVAKEWSPRNASLKPTQVTPYANRKVWWKCEQGHEWFTLISTRAYGSKCPYCSGIKLLKGFNDLASLHPQLALEWSQNNGTLLPEDFNERSTKNVWWKCSTCGHEYRAVIKSKVHGLKCPVCTRNAVLPGYSDLATTDPELAQEWNAARNTRKPTEISRLSQYPVWWKGICGHEWKDKVFHRAVEGAGCIYCEKAFDTALQLTGFDPVMASIRHYDFADAAKDTPFYKEIIQAMLDYFETEHYVFTHGWIPSIPNRDKSYSYISSWREADREQWNQARWFNGMDAAQTADENKTIVCGHWHTSYGHSKYEHKGTEFGEDADFSPYYGPGIIAIDACTAFSGKVNCLVMED